MYRRIALTTLFALLVSEPLLAERRKVRVYFGIDPEHPYINRVYVDEATRKEKPEYDELRRMVLEGFIGDLLKEKLGFVEIDQSKSVTNELRIEIADKEGVRTVERDVYFRIQLVRFENNAWVKGDTATYWEFRKAVDWSRSKRAAKFAPEIVQQLLNNLRKPSEVDRMVQEQFKFLKIAEKADHVKSKAEFEVPIRAEELFIGHGTFFQIIATTNRSGVSLTRPYGAEFKGSNKSKGLFVIAVPQQMKNDIDQIVGANTVNAAGVSITTFRYAPPINDTSNDEGFQKRGS